MKLSYTINDKTYILTDMKNGVAHYKLLTK